MVEEINALNFTLENPNGQADEYPNNDAKIIDIPMGPDATPTITLILKLDDNPEEITWEFLNSQGTVVYEGGPYSEPGLQFLEQFDFNSTDCYTFFIYDAGGDGLTGTGSYAIGYGSNVIAQGTDFGFKDEGQFIIAYTDVEGLVSNQELKISPNPVFDRTNLQFTLTKEDYVSYSIVNLLGKMIKDVELGFEKPGFKSYSVDLNGLESGIYFINLKVGTTNYVEKIIKAE